MPEKYFGAMLLVTLIAPIPPIAMLDHAVLQILRQQRIKPSLWVIISRGSIGRRACERIAMDAQKHVDVRREIAIIHARLKLLRIRRRRPVNVAIVFARHYHFDAGIFENLLDLFRHVQRDVFFP